MRIDEFAKTADGTLSAADRTRFSCVGFDITISTPAIPTAHRGGDAYIHHGRRPTVAPLPPLQPEPSIQPYVFFETGLTKLTLFFAGKTTLHFHEQAIEHIVPVSVPFDLVRLREARFVTIASLLTRTIEELNIYAHLQESYLINVEEEDRLTILETTAVSHRWTFHEQCHEEMALEAAGVAILTDNEQLTEELMAPIVLRPGWNIRETPQEVNLRPVQQPEIISGISQENLMEAIALTAICMLEEDL